MQDSCIKYSIQAPLASPSCNLFNNSNFTSVVLLSNFTQLVAFDSLHPKSVFTGQSDKLEQIPGDYDNVDQRALELLKTNDYELAEYMRDYIKELYANIHMRDFYIRNLKDEILHTLKHRDSISGEELLQILNKVAPWDMEYDGRWQTRDYLARAKANQ